MKSKFKKNDVVTHDAHPEWGKGEVTRVSPSGQIEMDKTVFVYQKTANSAMLAIKFTDGRTRNLWDTDSQLKQVETTEKNTAIRRGHANKQIHRTVSPAAHVR